MKNEKVIMKLAHKKNLGVNGLNQKKRRTENVNLFILNVANMYCPGNFSKNLRQIQREDLPFLENNTF